jgi:hypothetical protein
MSHLIQISLLFLFYSLGIVLLDFVRRRGRTRELRTGNLWREYFERAESYSTDFVYSVCYSLFAHDTNDNRKLDETVRDTRRGIRGREMVHNGCDMLRQSEFHLRFAHYEGWYIVIASCSLCFARLSMYACCLGQCYFCVDCIKNHLLPTFCVPRLLLLESSGSLVKDAVTDVARCLVILSLRPLWSGRAEFVNESERRCGCTHFYCRSPEERRRILKMDAELAVLRRSLTYFPVFE